MKQTSNQNVVLRLSSGKRLNLPMENRLLFPHAQTKAAGGLNEKRRGSE